MAVSYSFRSDLVIFYFEGNQTLDETQAVFARAFDDPGFPNGGNVLIDARRSREKRDGNELAALAALFGRKRGLVGPKCALIVGEDNPNQEDYERIISCFSDRYKVRFFVFFSEVDALAWLLEPACEDA
jgi:hypothetical protein